MKVLLAAAVASLLGHTTLEQRIVAAPPQNGFSQLTTAPGDPYVVREDLAKAHPGREKRRRSLTYFAQLSDFQLADEESPARVEVLDAMNELFNAAWRPQEALMPFAVDASIRQVNSHTTSPTGTRAKLAFTILTGDNADNMQLNEARWVDRLLEGGRLDPNSGTADAAAYAGTNCPPGAQQLLAAEAPNYTGVQDYDDYQESGTFYDPDQPSAQYATWPKYEHLMDRAQQPFETPGLDVPSYVALGNHDGLVQGNQAANKAFKDVATGCYKSISPTFDQADLGHTLTATILTSSPQNTLLVPPDPNRTPVAKPDYRAVFTGGRQSDAHGFAYIDASELKASNGAASYYTFSPAPGLRFIALDTIASGGVAGPSADGNVDDPEFQWLKAKLDQAEQAGELVVVFSHHGPTSLTADVPDEVAGECDSPDVDPGCDLDPRDSQPLHLGGDLTALLLAHPHVIAWVAGHSHINDVQLAKTDKGTGFWIVRTSAEADFPHQDRLLEVTDNRDGTLSLFGTLLDNAAPVAAPAPGNAAAFGPDQLASLARTLGFNDPQINGSAAGEKDDRNVELLLKDPRPFAPATPARPRVTLRVRPRRVRVGRRVTLHITVRPARRTRVQVAGRHVRTGRRGRAAIRIRFRRTGIHRVRIKGASAPVVVVRH